MWKQVAVVTECRADDLMSDTIVAVVVSGSFIENRIFRAARALPWSLAVGDIDQNMAKLAASEEEPGDATARKIRLLLKAKYNTQQLRQGIEMFRDCSWSSVVVEQSHGSASTIKKQHSEHARDMLMQRSMIHMMRPLVSASQEEIALKRLKEKLDALKMKRPSKIGGARSSSRIALTLLRG